MGMMISMGVVAISGGSNIESAKNAVVRICNTSRQFAVASGLPVAMEIWIDGVPDYDPDNVTADISALDITVGDKMVVAPYKRLKDVLTGKYQLAINEERIETSETLPPEIPFIYVPGTGLYRVIEETGGGSPTDDIERTLLTYKPDGSCKSNIPNIALPWTDPGQDANATGSPSWFSNYLIIQDAMTSERAMIYIYETTGFVHEVLEVSQ